LTIRKAHQQPRELGLDDPAALPAPQEVFMSLSEKTCVPCQGGQEPMERSQAQEMVKQVPGWDIDEEARRIVRHFKFRNFMEAVEFVNRAAQLAEQQDHHPDILLGYGYAEIWIHTHKIGGLHDNDFILAAKINELE
jgi:4a-hydroxytetrahydrobiopterin dehydratase